MKENKLLQLAQEFAIDIIKISQLLKEGKEFSFADQIKRSGTSISANIAEGNHPQSRADMISKFEIALKEANETENWLVIFQNSELIDRKVIDSAHKKLIKLKIILIASIKTLKASK
jgi:four helix bundle protein